MPGIPALKLLNVKHHLERKLEHKMYPTVQCYFREHAKSTGFHKAKKKCCIGITHPTLKKKIVVLV